MTPNQPNVILVRLVVALAVCVLLSAVVVAYLWLRPVDGAQGAREIAYVAVGTDGNLDLFLSDAAARRITQLTKTTDDEVYPAWSPDGKMLAYMRMPLRMYRGTASTPGTGMYLMTFEGGTPREQELLPASRGGMGEPSWSPDGRRIAFLSPMVPLRDGGYVTGTLTVVTLSPRAAETIPMTVPVGILNSSVSWSPDGGAVAFIAPTSVITVSAGRYPEIPEAIPSAAWVYSMSDRSLRVAAHDANLVSWSPDGGWLAYTDVRSGKGVRLVRPDGTGERVLTERWYASAIAWSPDGRSLAACGWMEDDQESGVAIFSLDDGSAASFALGDQDHLPQFVSWSPDGAYLSVSLFSDSGGMMPDGSLWIVDAKTGAAFAFPDNPGMEALAVWRPGK